jgi:uncharacterized membrane protein
MSIKVLYVGDSVTLIGPIFIASPFIMEIKEFNVSIVAKPLIDVFQKNPEINLRYMTSWDAYSQFPKTKEELKNYDVLILSDVDADTIYFYPEFYMPSEWGKTIAMPNRLKSIKDFVNDGGGLIMAGSWFTFSGRYGRGGWQNTPVAEILPVKILNGDDRVESPEGAKVKVLNSKHPIMRDIPWEDCPPFLGYNKTLPKENAEILATIGENNDPFIAIWEYGNGRVMAFTSDPCPHWGINFMKWKYYEKFWIQAVKWLAKK